jgi:hypothetical protein
MHRRATTTAATHTVCGQSFTTRAMPPPAPRHRAANCQVQPVAPPPNSVRAGGPVPAGRRGCGVSSQLHRFDGQTAAAPIGTKTFG